MGIRMHLAVGYGLDLNVFEDLRADRSQLSFDDDGALENPERFEAFRADVKSFAKTTGEVMENLIFHEAMNPVTALHQMVSHDDEFGLEDKVLLTPALSREEWSRYGNNLDAFLYETQHDSMTMDLESEWLSHPGTLYPYVGLMKANPDMPLGVEKYWESCYRDKPEHKDAIAWAPWHLWFVIKHLRLWPEDMTTAAFLSLRPTIYRYWS